MRHIRRPRAAGLYGSLLAVLLIALIRARGIVGTPHARAQPQPDISSMLNQKGIAYRARGDFAQALYYYKRGLALKEKTGDRAGAASILNNIGTVYCQQGDFAQALEYYNRCLKLKEKIGDREGVASTLNNIGLVRCRQGRYGLALEYFRRSLRISEASGDEAGVASTLNNIGLVRCRQGRYGLALEYFRRSLRLKAKTRDPGSFARTLDNMGNVCNHQGNPAKALRFAQRAAIIARRISDLETLWNARTIAGRAYRRLGRPDAACEAYKEAIATIERLRTRVAGGEQEQQCFFEDKIVPYHELVEMLVAQNKPAEAFLFAEQAKARVLLDVLQSGRANITKAMTPPEQERERRLNRELASVNVQITREGQREQPDESRLARLKARQRRAQLDREDFHTSLYATHPERKAQHGQARPLTLQEAGNLLPDARRALLEFVVTREKTYLFVLTRVRQGTARIKAYALPLPGRQLADRIQHLRQQLARADPGFRKNAHELYDRLLRSAREPLKGKTTLVIVPEGALWELPFQALLSRNDRYLLQDYVLSYAPSLTVLREMIKARGKKQPPSPARTLLAIGDPALGQATPQRIASGFRSAKLVPLPEAGREVEALGRLYGPKRSRVYKGVDASEERVKAEAGSYRIVHLAAHGTLDDASPMYSHVVLSQAAGNGSDDGLLEAWELMDLDLHAELVVLSACETARGRVGAGEGMIGLSWALFVAGCPTTVVSQWKVHSASTAPLMIAFHQSLQAGDGKAAALRHAALTLLRGDQYHHPFYWAGFVVVGDGR